MNDLFDEQFIKELTAASLPGRAAVGTATVGLRKSHAKGSSVEFSDFREYLFGDDVRRLDWNAYARLGKLYMKLYQEEREGIFSFYLDLSPSMNYGEAAKARQVLRIAAGLSYMALKGQDRVRLILCGIPEEVGTSLPRVQSFHGSAAFTKVLDYLSRVEQIRQIEYIPYMQHAFTGKTMDAAENATWEPVRRFEPPLGGTSVMISDFMPEDVSETVKFLRLHRKQDLWLLQVLAEEELHPEFAGTNQLLDMENAGELRITLTPALLRTYQKELEHLTTQLMSLADRYQSHYELVHSGQRIVWKKFAKL